MASKAQTIDAWLVAHARHQPTRIALSFEGQNWSYRELSDWVERLACSLQQDLMLKRGERLAYYGKNSAVQVALMFACARIGVIFAPLNWRLDPSELNFMVGDCDPAVLVHFEEFEEHVPMVLQGQRARAIGVGSIKGREGTVTTNAELSDPFLIVYTSGTTGRPKGAVITQEAVLWNAIISLHAHDFTAKDHTLNLLPLFHVGGINIQMMPTFFVGGQVTLHAAFDPTLALETLTKGTVTSTVCVPTVMKALLDHPDWDTAQFPALRLINTGSTDVPVEILQAVQARGIPMVQVYGSTETGPIATYQRAQEAVSTVGSIGRCGAHTQVSVRQADGGICGVGVAGEIWVKGPNNFSYYWNAPELTEAAVQDGWFKTGDVAFQDAEGLFWFSGRSKHVIISGGENIYPAEIERILARVSGISECAVVGRAHPKWGEVPVAAVVVSPDGPSREDILAAFDGKLARFKHPKDVIFFDELPKNALGKVLVETLRSKVSIEMSD